MANVDPTWYLKPPGGGPLFDRIVYPMHFMTGVLGPAKRVTALSGIVVPEREYQGRKIRTEMDDNTLMLLDFGESFYVFVYGAVGGGTTNGIFGTEGTIRFEKSGPVLNGEPVSVSAEGGSVSGLPHVTGRHLEIPAAHIFEDIMQLVDWVVEDKASIVTAEHARHVIDIFESAYASARSGRSIDLRTTF